MRSSASPSPQYIINNNNSSLHQRQHHQSPLSHPSIRASSSPIPIHVPISIPTQLGAAAPDSNGYRKDMRDKARDDTLSIIHDRKVRITEGASLYVLCRSWLRNGSHEESQVQYVHVPRSLPKPLPLPKESCTLLKKKEGEEKDVEDKDEETHEHLSAEDLLKGHVKRARKVRARLREERQLRIARYKPRLAQLLPPLVEQFRNDLSAGN